MEGCRRGLEREVPFFMCHPDMFLNAPEGCRRGTHKGSRSTPTTLSPTTLSLFGLWQHQSRHKGALLPIERIRPWE